MFLNYTSGITYMAAKSVIPDKYDGIAYSGPPQPGTSAYPGAALVAQYLESFQFRTGTAKRVQEARIKAAAEKAAALDEADFDAGAVECVSETCPSLNNLMKAFVELGYAQNTSGVGFVKAAQADVKYFIRQYSGIVLEMKITNTTYNASGFDISSAGSLETRDFTKGFLAFGYDSQYIYLQNSLGASAGSAGFHRMPWSVAGGLMVKGAVWKLENPS